jgi:transposase
LLLSAAIHPADIQDRDGAIPLLRAARRLFPFVEVIFADGAYRGETTAKAVAGTGRWRLEIVSRGDAGGFVPLAKRWIVERTFAWLGRCRRLAKDFENLAVNALAFLCLGMIRLMLRRLARASAA